MVVGSTGTYLHAATTGDIAQITWPQWRIEFLLRKSMETKGLRVQRSTTLAGIEIPNDIKPNSEVYEVRLVKVENKTGAKVSRLKEV